ncbi:alpha/beta fold hydrolase [Thermodesulfobacteriota bacterium]
MTDFPMAEKISLPERKGSRGSVIAPIDLAVYGAGSGPTVVLCHGFPEIGYSWRYQIPALAEAGFRVIVPDQRGYGASDAPDAVEDYTLEHLTSDLVGILDHYEIEKAVFAGHDWGGFVVWCMPLAFPDRTAGVIGVNTPFMPFPGTSLLRETFSNDEDLYILWFQQEGIAEGVMDSRARLVFEKNMRGGIRTRRGMLSPDGPKRKANFFIDLETRKAAGPEILSEAELNHYIEVYQRTGFRGGINWYRNIDKNFDLYPEMGKKKLDLPCLMVTAEWDFALSPSLADGMPQVCSDLEMHMIEKCGHWTQQEKPEELNRIMTHWLRERFL